MHISIQISIHIYIYIYIHMYTQADTYTHMHVVVEGGGVSDLGSRNGWVQWSLRRIEWASAIRLELKATHPKNVTSAASGEGGLWRCCLVSLTFEEHVVVPRFTLLIEVEKAEDWAAPRIYALRVRADQGQH